MTLSEHIKALREALEAGPTPGPWKADDCSVELACTQSEYRTMNLGLTTVGERDEIELAARSNADAAYIAAANPAVITALLDKLGEMDEALKPFAEAAKTLDFYEDGSPMEDNLKCGDDEAIENAIYERDQPSIGDLRRAAAARIGE